MLSAPPSKAKASTQEKAIEKTLPRHARSSPSNGRDPRSNRAGIRGRAGENLGGGGRSYSTPSRGNFQPEKAPSGPERGKSRVSAKTRGSRAARGGSGGGRQGNGGRKRTERESDEEDPAPGSEDQYVLDRSIAMPLHDKCLSGLSVHITLLSDNVCIRHPDPQSYFPRFSRLSVHVLLHLLRPVL